MIEIRNRAKERRPGRWKRAFEPLRTGRGGILAGRVLAVVAIPAMCLLAGCGGGGSANSNGALSITPGIGTIDTNCTGCNATSSSGAAVEQFTAALSSGGAASVTWTVSGGDANSGPGTITSGGQYTPPSYLTADQASVTVTAALSGSSSNTATAVVTVTPGFLQPLTPENASLGASGTLSLSGYLAELGGTAGITYGLSSTASGSSGGLGTLGASTCTRGGTAFTYCTVTYTAPATSRQAAPSLWPR